MDIDRSIEVSSAKIRREVPDPLIESQKVQLSILLRESLKV